MTGEWHFVYDKNAIITYKAFLMIEPTTQPTSESNSDELVAVQGTDIEILPQVYIDARWWGYTIVLNQPAALCMDKVLEDLERELLRYFHGEIAAAIKALILIKKNILNWWRIVGGMAAKWSLLGSSRLRLPCAGTIPEGIKIFGLRCGTLLRGNGASKQNSTMLRATAGLPWPSMVICCTACTVALATTKACTGMCIRPITVGVTTKSSPTQQIARLQPHPAWLNSKTNYTASIVVLAMTKPCIPAALTRQPRLGAQAITS